MTPTVQSALEELAACKTAGDVAGLLRRHGCRGERGEQTSCPLAAYFRRVGKAGVVLAFGWCAEVDGEAFDLPRPCSDFVSLFDDGKYDDLRSA